jgi:hypothetical protein
MIRSAMIADDAECEAFRHEPTNTFDETSPRISLRLNSAVIPQEMLPTDMCFARHDINRK